MTMRADLDHLPAAKRRELERVARVLFDEFEDAVTTKLSDKRKGGRILKLILFGSYARGDWVEDRARGYIRSEGRRGGQEWVSTCRSRSGWAHEKETRIRKNSS